MNETHARSLPHDLAADGFVLEVDGLVLARKVLVFEQLLLLETLPQQLLVASFSSR